MKRTRTNINIQGKKIKLIALDLDGTTLTKRGLTRRTRNRLEMAIAQGTHVVVATGRTYTAVPKKILSINGLRYVITSNGAQITDLDCDQVVYSNYICEGACKSVAKVLQEAGFPIEIFINGRAYIDREVYEDIRKNGSTFMNAEYIMRTRNPVESIYKMLDEHCGKVENINIHFEDLAYKDGMREKLEQIDNITLTSSLPHNLEVGGATTSKATGIEALCQILDVEMAQVMACGDSPNDSAMIKAAGLGIAVASGEDEVKAIADYVVPSNEEEGVAYAVEKFVLGLNPDRFIGLNVIKNKVLNGGYGLAKRIYKLGNGNKGFAESSLKNNSK